MVVSSPVTLVALLLLAILPGCTVTLAMAQANRQLWSMPSFRNLTSDADAPHPIVTRTVDLSSRCFAPSGRRCSSLVLPLGATQTVAVCPNRSDCNYAFMSLSQLPNGAASVASSGGLTLLVTAAGGFATEIAARTSFLSAQVSEPRANTTIQLRCDLPTEMRNGSLVCAVKYDALLASVIPGTNSREAAEAAEQNVVLISKTLWCPSNHAIVFPGATVGAVRLPFGAAHTVSAPDQSALFDYFFVSLSCPTSYALVTVYDGFGMTSEELRQTSPNTCSVTAVKLPGYFTRRVFRGYTLTVQCFSMVCDCELAFLAREATQPDPLAPTETLALPDTRRSVLLCDKCAPLRASSILPKPCVVEEFPNTSTTRTISVPGAAHYLYLSAVASAGAAVYFNLTATRNGTELDAFTNPCVRVAGFLHDVVEGGVTLVIGCVPGPCNVTMVFEAPTPCDQAPVGDCAACAAMPYCAYCVYSGRCLPTAPAEPEEDAVVQLLPGMFCGSEPVFNEPFTQTCANIEAPAVAALPSAARVAALLPPVLGCPCAECDRWGFVRVSDGTSGSSFRGSVIYSFPYPWDGYEGELRTTNGAAFDLRALNGDQYAAWKNGTGYSYMPSGLFSQGSRCARRSPFLQPHTGLHLLLVCQARNAEACNVVFRIRPFNTTHLPAAANATAPPSSDPNDPPNPASAWPSENWTFRFASTEADIDALRANESAVPTANGYLLMKPCPTCDWGAVCGTGFNTLAARAACASVLGTPSTTAVPFRRADAGSSGPSELLQLLNGPGAANIVFASGVSCKNTYGANLSSACSVTLSTPNSNRSRCGVTTQTVASVYCRPPLRAQIVNEAPADITAPAPPISPGAGPSYGRVLVRPEISGAAPFEWGTVDAEGSGTRESDAVCRMLGFNASSSSYVMAAGPGIVAMRTLRCGTVSPHHDHHGADSAPLASCSYLFSADASIGVHQEDLAVVCDASPGPAVDRDTPATPPAMAAYPQRCPFIIPAGHYEMIQNGVFRSSAFVDHDTRPINNFSSAALVTHIQTPCPNAGSNTQYSVALSSELFQDPIDEAVCHFTAANFCYRNELTPGVFNTSSGEVHINFSSSNRVVYTRFTPFFSMPNGHYCAVNEYGEESRFEFTTDADRRSFYAYSDWSRQCQAREYTVYGGSELTMPHLQSSTSDDACLRESALFGRLGHRRDIVVNDDAASFTVNPRGHASLRFVRCEPSPFECPAAVPEGTFVTGSQTLRFYSTSLALMPSPSGRLLLNHSVAHYCNLRSRRECKDFRYALVRTRVGCGLIAPIFRNSRTNYNQEDLNLHSPTNAIFDDQGGLIRIASKIGDSFAFWRTGVCPFSMPSRTYCSLSSTNFWTWQFAAAGNVAIDEHVKVDGSFSTSCANVGYKMQQVGTCHVRLDTSECLESSVLAPAASTSVLPHVYFGANDTLRTTISGDVPTDSLRCDVETMPRGRYCSTSSSFPGFLFVTSAITFDFATDKSGASRRCRRVGFVLRPDREILMARDDSCLANDPMWSGVRDYYFFLPDEATIVMLTDNGYVRLEHCEGFDGWQYVIFAAVHGGAALAAVGYKIGVHVKNKRAAAAALGADDLEAQGGDVDGGIEMSASGAEPVPRLREDLL